MSRGWAAAAAVVLTACGVQQQDDPEPVPSEQLPRELQPGPARPADAPATATVYLVQDGRLVRHRQAADGDDAISALRSLLSAPAPQDSRRSAVPAGTALRGTTVDGDLVTVDLTMPFGEVRGQDQLLAVAQLVWTVTEQRGLRRVRIEVEGRPVPLPVDDGAASAAAVTRDDYASVAPVR